MSKFGFYPRKRHILEKLDIKDKDGKPIDNMYICLTCERDKRAK